MKHPPRTFARLSPLAILILILLAAIARGAPPNVVLFLVDDLGYGDLSSYGHPTIKTPNIDGIGERGIRLTSYYAAAPSCSPSRAALLTGRYPLRVGLPRVLGPETTLGIPAAELTLAEALKEKGYRTAAIGKWHVGHAKPEFLPTGQGFDSYFGLLYSNDMIRPWVNTDRPLELWRNDRPIEHPVDQTQLTVRYTEEAQKFIRSSEGNPFFLYLPYSMVHVPIHAAPQFRDKSRAGPYGDVVEAIDWSVGQVLKTLHEVGVVDNTLVVFTSDNGPWQNMPDRMFQGNVIKPWHAGSAGPLRGYKATTYEGGVRVPAIIQWPSRIEGGRASADIVTAMDLYVTILKAAGAAVPSD
ncbi:MAG TPA: sulfatase-like hydrolase/transferase, partial [Acidobacteriota bacterium]|nr:sulfatase-like hydrolase/transferase [Acidobacteriota bacterium]